MFSEKNYLRSEQIQSSLQALNLAEKHLNSALKNIEKSEEFVQSATVFGEEIHQNPSELCTEFDEKMCEFGDEIAADLSDAYYQITKAFSSFGSHIDYADTADPDIDYNPEIADAFAEDGTIFVRVPMLGKRVIRTGKSPGGPWAMEGMNFYRKELKAALMRISEHINWTESRTLNYVFVYHTNRIGIDSDSHDTKGITDTICSFYRGSDDNRYCSFTYSTLHTMTVPEGTYIAITPGKMSPYDPIDTVKVWIQHHTAATRFSAKNVDDKAERIPSKNGSF